jgi:SAM-dependent methyltransferase
MPVGLNAAPTDREGIARGARTSVEASSPAAICPVCGGGASQRIAKQPRDWEYDVEPAHDAHIRKCQGCDTEFVHPRPSVAELVSFYPADYHAYHEDHGLVAGTLVRMRSRQRAKVYRRLCGSDRIRLFDVGTGDCRHFDELAPFGQFDCAGVELHPGMVAAARARGYDVTEGTLEEMDLTEHAGRYDIVTMYQLVEHVLDPPQLFARAKQLLRPGGWILGQLPRCDSIERRLFGRYWAGYHFPRHLQLFTRSALHDLLERGGFTGVRVDPALHLQAGLSIQNTLLGGLHWRPKRTFGKAPGYSLMLLAAAPYCMLEHLFRRGGMMNFAAQKPHLEEAAKHNTDTTIAPGGAAL